MNLLMENWILWIFAAIVLIIVEMITPGVFFFLCLGLGALVVALFSYLGYSIMALWAIFFASSILFILIARPLTVKYIQTKARPSNVDELIGAEARVIEPISPHKSGQIKIRGEVWRADASEDIEIDSIVEILKVNGTYLNVKRKE